MARETALKISTVKVNPFKNGCNRMPKESKKKARLKGIPASLPFPDIAKMATPTNKRQDKIKEI